MYSYLHLYQHQHLRLQLQPNQQHTETKYMAFHKITLTFEQGEINLVCQTVYPNVILAAPALTLPPPPPPPLALRIQMAFVLLTCKFIHFYFKLLLLEF